MAERLKVTARQSFFYEGAMVKRGEPVEAKASDVKWMTEGDRPLVSTAAAKKSAPAESLEGKTKDELYEIATERDIEGRSSMTKAELVKALK